MEKREQMIAALKKVMDSLADVFMGFAHMCEGVPNRWRSFLSWPRMPWNDMVLPS
ncbi:hypothetical protein NUITMVRE5_29310 [Enterococcus faecium]|nr:hypothetical protein NUITMVRE31_27140 [Enterococcus faecium]GMS62927.1 hypothetical protein NUITMVRE4_29260 [Enterococcus faecium]GMS65898.1 hypothetical protein NUITMVRE5_29310 [Enterococcus faecium]GMS71809.1 hypothetical protein NUITMVRE7_29140 [Enterococcus faecium]GMS77752.1 hypothetical protein NUITMVRE9_29040 [Enterococcus faecium]